MKKLITLMIVAVFCISIALPGNSCATNHSQKQETSAQQGCADATEPDADISVNDMKQYLLQRDYPSDYLDGLIDEQIEGLYEIAVNDLAARFYSVENKTVSISENDNNLTRGVIPTSELNYQIALTLATSYYGNKQYITKVYVTITYDWLKLPAFRLNDAIAVNWDSNKLGYVDNTFKEYNYGKVSGTWVTYNTYTASSELRQGGLGTFAPLNLQNATGLKGTVSFQLEPRPLFSMGYVPDGSATTINAQYTHNKNSMVGLTFGVQGASVSINSSGLADSIAKSSTIYYAAL